MMSSDSSPRSFFLLCSHLFSFVLSWVENHLSLYNFLDAHIILVVTLPSGMPPIQFMSYFCHVLFTFRHSVHPVCHPHNLHGLSKKSSCHNSTSTFIDVSINQVGHLSEFPHCLLPGRANSLHLLKFQSKTLQRSSKNVKILITNLVCISLELHLTQNRDCLKFILEAMNFDFITVPHFCWIAGVGTII